MGSSLFPSFFDLAPAGQDFLKQSATRINFIGCKVVAMTLEMYRTPRHMVETLSALGLRHVGYAIPTEMQLGQLQVCSGLFAGRGSNSLRFPPFVSAAVALIQRHTTDENLGVSHKFGVVFCCVLILGQWMERVTNDQKRSRVPCKKIGKMTCQAGG